MQFDNKCSLFYLELPDGTLLSHEVADNDTFPSQFGREVILETLPFHRLENPQAYIPCCLVKAFIFSSLGFRGLQIGI